MPVLHYLLHPGNNNAGIAIADAVFSAIFRKALLVFFPSKSFSKNLESINQKKVVVIANCRQEYKI